MIILTPCVLDLIAETAKSTGDCPHQFGYFRLGDERNCGQFMNCVDGRGYVFDCPEGLAFNQESYRCDWPDQVASCDAEGSIIIIIIIIAKGILKQDPEGNIWAQEG